MITSTANAASYLRPAQTYPSKTVLTPANALPTAGANGSTAVEETPGIPVSALRKIDTSGLKIISVADNPELRDRMATNWLNMRANEAVMATDVPDNAPQNTYATVKVNGKVVTTLYNGGGSAMTNAAAAEAGNVPDPPSLMGGGPNLAQWRAEYIAKALGGTIEKAPTAITQSEWTPRQSVSTNYTREQLDTAFQAMMTEGQKATAQRPAGYPTPQGSSGVYSDFSA